jgi:two-component system chemotaxis sensor kinase CheA
VIDVNELNADDGIIAELIPAFIEEANELIASLEQLLLQLEDTPDDRDLLDALFRCAHTIKGSAGVFGLDRIVAFTHHVETLLSQVRDGQVKLTPALGTLLLQSNDAIRSLVAAAQGDQTDTAEAEQARESLVKRLREATNLTAGVTHSDGHEPENVPDNLTPEHGIRRWHVSVKFEADTFRHGLDPLAIINYLGGMGCIPNVVVDALAVPALDSFDPENCYLGVELSLDTAASREEIEQAFSFVREDCTLHLIGPGSGPQDFVDLISAIPDNPRLGDILVSVGAITRAQLLQGLQHQADALDTTGTAPLLGELLQSGTGLSNQVVAAALQKQQQQRKAGGSAEDNAFIRVHAHRLDEVINLLGELVIAGAGASMLARQTRQRGLIEANHQITRLIEGLRNSALKLRMVPIGDTFSRFKRVVRDTAGELGKDVQLEIVGGETELDKAMVERMVDPLMHLVRNALDHGLETPEQRLTSGKAEQGKMTLSACHESGGILIKIMDDGRGIQREKVLQRAWERGLLEQGHVPSDEDIDKLIFEPGFSTAETVTNLSGRGVGMDVVRSNIEALRGTVTIDSTPGQGSCIEIRLPLTLAIIDGFLIGVGTSKFVFPLDAVVEVIEGQRVPTTQDSQGRSCIELRGQVLPVVNLRQLYALESAQPERCSIVVIRAANRRYGVLVDVLLGQHQTVIKPLGLMLRSLRGVSGSSILGTGEVALIFDANALGQLAAKPRQTGSAPMRLHSDVIATSSADITGE